MQKNHCLRKALTDGASCPLQTSSVIAIGLGVDSEILARQGLCELRHTIPHRLCLLKKLTRLNSALRARTQSLRSAAPLCPAPAASVEQLILRTLAASAIDARGRFFQPVNPLPRLGCPFLMLNPFRFATESRTTAAQYSTRRYHPGHRLPRHKRTALR